MKRPSVPTKKCEKPAERDCRWWTPPAEERHLWERVIVQGPGGPLAVWRFKG